ncbi:hypothetical protein ACTUVN_003413 [Pseudomonas caspiana]
MASIERQHRKYQKWLIDMSGFTHDFCAVFIENNSVNIIGTAEGGEWVFLTHRYRCLAALVSAYRKALQPNTQEVFFETAL